MFKIKTFVKTKNLLHGYKLGTDFGSFYKTYNYATCNKHNIVLHYFDRFLITACKTLLEFLRSI